MSKAKDEWKRGRRDCLGHTLLLSHPRRLAGWGKCWVGWIGANARALCSLARAGLARFALALLALYPPPASDRLPLTSVSCVHPRTVDSTSCVCACPVCVYDFSSRRSLHPFNQLAHVPCVRAHSPPRPLDTQPQSRRVSQPRPLTPPDTHATRVTLFFQPGLPQSFCACVSILVLFVDRVLGNPGPGHPLETRFADPFLLVT